MAYDIKNTNDGTTGTQRLGLITVNTGGRKANTTKSYNPGQPDVKDVDIADIHDKYDDRFDDPRYYQGDAAT